MVEHLRVTFRGNSSEQLSHRGIICSKQPAVNAEQKQDERDDNKPRAEDHVDGPEPGPRGLFQGRSRYFMTHD